MFRTLELLELRLRLFNARRRRAATTGRVRSCQDAKVRQLSRRIDDLRRR